MVHLFSPGDQVRTLQSIGQWPRGSIGTIQAVFAAGRVLDVLFARYHLPVLIYHDRLEAMPPHQARA